MEEEKLDFKSLSERYKKELMTAYERYKPLVRPYGKSVAVSEEALPDSERLSLRTSENSRSEENLPEENIILPIKPLTSVDAPSSEDGSEPETEKEMKNVGYIKVVVSVAAEAVPIPGAEVFVTRDGDGEKNAAEVYKTDLSGGTPVISVPAPNKENSLSPDTSGAPFYEYRIVVEVEGYERVVIEKVPVFEGVLSIQPISLRPLSTVSDGKSD